MLSFGEIVRLNALRIPYETAIVWNDVRLNYKELNRRTNAIANAMIKMGVKKGDRVGIHLPNCPQLFTAITQRLAASCFALVWLSSNPLTSRIKVTSLASRTRKSGS